MHHFRLAVIIVIIILGQRSNPVEAINWGSSPSKVKLEWGRYRPVEARQKIRNKEELLLLYRGVRWMDNLVNVAYYFVNNRLTSATYSLRENPSYNKYLAWKFALTGQYGHPEMSTEESFSYTTRWKYSLVEASLSWWRIGSPYMIAIFDCQVCKDAFQEKVADRGNGNTKTTPAKRPSPPVKKSKDASANTGPTIYSDDMPVSGPAPPPDLRGVRWGERPEGVKITEVHNTLISEEATSDDALRIEYEPADFYPLKTIGKLTYVFVDKQLKWAKFVFDTKDPVATYDEARSALNKRYGDGTNPHALGFLNGTSQSGRTTVWDTQSTYVELFWTGQDQDPPEVKWLKRTW